MSIRRHGQLLSGALAADFQKSAIRGTSDPTASTAGYLTQGYVNTATGNAWFCSAIDDTDPQNVVYTWTRILMATEKGVANGLASLDSNGKVPSSELPSMDFIPSSEKGAAGGVAQLDANGLVPSGELPIGGRYKLGLVKSGGSIVSIADDGTVFATPANNAQINGRNTNIITPSNLDYAVRSVLPNVTVIPAATTEYSLVDASATTNNHSWQYFHAPAEASTYTFPAVTDTTVAHRIKLTLDFTTVQTYSFEDAEGTAIVPLFTPTISAGDVYEFDCEYSAVKAQWLVWPHKQGAVADDYVMQSQVGAANGVAVLDGNSLVPEANLPKASSSDYGTVKGNNAQGIYVSGGNISIFNAQPNDINLRTNAYRPIVPNNLNYAVTAALTDANKIQFTDAQKASAQDTLGAAPATLHLDAAPTTATVGAFGQRAIVDSTGKAYTCTAVTVDDTDPQNPVTTYTWTDDINANGGTFTGEVTWQRPTSVFKTIITPYKIISGKGNSIIGNESIAVGDSNTASNSCCILVGTLLTGVEYCQAVFGRYNIPSNNCSLVIGAGTSRNNLINNMELSWSGDHYIVGGHQQGITVIPAATTTYALTEGVQSHTPSDASTYALPAITQRIIADGKYFERNIATDGATYYGWLNGTTNRYTASPTPAVGTNTYTNTALTAGASAVTAIDNRTHECILTVLFRGYYRYADGDSGSAYCWKANDGTLLYTDTTTITEGTTKAYSDIALTTEAGTIALYDSVKTAFALVGSYSFEDASGNAIVPLPSSGTPSVGAVFTFLCRWEALLGQWVVMPIPVGKEQTA